MTARKRKKRRLRPNARQAYKMLQKVTDDGMLRAREAGRSAHQFSSADHKKRIAASNAYAAALRSEK